METRNAHFSEIVALAQIWFDGWRDAHINIVPESLARLRTLEDFNARMQRGLENVRVIGPVGEPTGFCMVNGDEVN